MKRPVYSGETLGTGNIVRGSYATNLVSVVTSSQALLTYWCSILNTNSYYATTVSGRISGSTSIPDKGEDSRLILGRFYSAVFSHIYC